MSQANAQTPAAAPTPAPKPKPKPRPPAPPIPPEFRSAAIMNLNSADAVKVLKDSASTEFQKSKACMRLAMVGERDAVPALAAFLGDPKLNQYARFGMVPIADPSVDDTFRAALGTLKGHLLVGVIDSIGQRKDPKAVDALSKLMYGSDREVAVAAAASLGRISGSSATAVLEEGLSKTQDPLRKDVAAACLVCAEEWLLKGNQKEALRLYARLSQSDIPKPVRIGAMNTIVRLETSPARHR